MILQRSDQADAVYIRFKEDDVEYSEEMGSDIIFDYNKNGQLVAIEILSVAEKKNFNELIINV